MPSASAGLELPATSLMAPFLDANSLSCAPGARCMIPNAGYQPSDKIMRKKQRPDTSRLRGWQHESEPCPREIADNKQQVSENREWRNGEWRTNRAAKALFASCELAIRPPPRLPRW